MKLYITSLKELLFSLIILFNSFLCYTQNSYNTVIKGKVIDAKTRAAMPFVSIILENTPVGALSDSTGRYSISTSKTAYKITFSFLGYLPESHIVTPGRVQTINVELTNSSVELGEVRVKATRQAYSNKNNPAVRLIEEVIKHKGSNRKESLDYYQYEKYEKIVIALSNISDKFEKLKLFSKFHFIFDNVDTTRIDGMDDLPLFIKEKRSSYYSRQNPKSDIEIIHGDKTINFEEYVDSKGLTANLNYLYQNINIYDNEIFFMSNKFLSPVASSAPILYRYFIQDTSIVENVRCIKLFFEPRNPSDFLFHGFLYITDDNNYSIRKIDMSFNKHINIDWIKDARIIQDFKEVGDKTWLLSRDEIAVDFGVTKGLPGVLGKRTVTYNDYVVNKSIPDSIFKGPVKVWEKEAYNRNAAFWESARNPPLDYSEKNLYTIIDSVKKVPAFKRYAKLVVLLGTNFLELGKFEIGPDVSFLSFNTIEGNRFRMGGRTTTDFSKSIYFESYLAYGSRDKQYKYKFLTTWSLSKKSIYRFPVKSIRLSYQYDTQIPGQNLLASASDNLFYSFKRGVNDKMYYIRTFGIDNMNEFENHFSYDLGYSFAREIPAGNLFFTSNSDLPHVNEVPFLQISEAYLNLRYAPKEEFYQGKIYRDWIPSKFPVLGLSYIMGSKYLGNDYNYQKLAFTISKRFYLSIVGYTDISAEAGKIFGKVPFPLLIIHNANQSFAYELNSFNMMNFMEFVSDQYVSLQINHSFNGFFFNKIPLLKRLKLREVMTFKALYGSLSNRNNPDLNPDLFKFPSDVNGIPLTYTLGRKPYIEASVGVSNIFKLFRVDIIKRITYLNNPNVTSLGLRVMFKLDF